ncbi:MFS transporter [Actinophytocola oryzae]|uniref:Putative MFS family arabinose efflux permease n=1 Tax=Actinophytocola oryzae TaxID=502181 RepID=A0A4R7VQC8_9PSEU|nr:MFS transporter [Actinophytocola oryzae]TDV51953.1 putative MFS family arabinose efflux permease [Actinophytocola oryzae]
MRSLFAGVAAVNTAMAGASTAATLIANDAAGPGWSGVPNAFSVLGTAAGTLTAGQLIARHGSRTVVRGLYGAAVVGALVAFAAATTHTMVVLIVGMFLLGLGNGAAQLSRYLAAEGVPTHRKGFAIAMIVWAGTVGAVVGPTLIAPGAGLATTLGFPALAGPVLVAVVMTAVAFGAATTLRRTPAPPARRTSLSALRTPVVLAPLVSMVCAQLTMVAIMSMTSLHMAAHGLEVLGVVLSVHMIGMFALAPLSGRLTDRFGGRAVIYLGIGCLAVAAVAAFGAGDVAGLSVAMFLLGYGWNLVFVGGSAILSRELPEDQRIQLQGAVDGVVWGTSALASLGAGLLFGVGGYQLVAVVGGLLALVPVTVLARRPAPAEPVPLPRPASAAPRSSPE